MEPQFDHRELTLVITHMPEYTEEQAEFAEQVIGAIFAGAEGIALEYDQEQNCPLAVCEFEDDLATFVSVPLYVTEKNNRFEIRAAG